MVIVFLWQMSGYIMLIYISFLSNIPREYTEAAKIDGANSWQTFFYVKKPLLVPAFTISLFLTLSNAFKLDEEIRMFLPREICDVGLLEIHKQLAAESA